MTDTQPRTPAGSPTGGQFRTTPGGAEASVALVASSASSWVARHSDGEVCARATNTHDCDSQHQYRRAIDEAREGLDDKFGDLPRLERSGGDVWYHVGGVMPDPHTGEATEAVGQELFAQSSAQGAAAIVALLESHRMVLERLAEISAEARLKLTLATDGEGIGAEHLLGQLHVIDEITETMDRVGRCAVCGAHTVDRQGTCVACEIAINSHAGPQPF